MNTDIKNLMDQLAAELKKPRKSQAVIDRLNKQLDKALGTELNPEDSSRAEVWEKSRR